MRSAMKPKVIGFGHQARVGKDTAGRYLLHKLPNSRHRAFAHSLKEACAAIFGFNDTQLNGNRKEEVDPFWGTTPRDLLQRVATEAIRNEVGMDVWVKSWEKYLKDNSYPHSRLWVVTDVRFPNEAEAVKRAGGILVKVTRPSELRDKVPNHVSETALSDYKGWDYTLNNDGLTLDSFYKRLDEFIEEFHLL
jgi:hypothetical protein